MVWMMEMIANLQCSTECYRSSMMRSSERLGSPWMGRRPAAGLDLDLAHCQKIGRKRRRKDSNAYFVSIYI